MPASLTPVQRKRANTLYEMLTADDNAIEELCFEYIAVIDQEGTLWRKIEALKRIAWAIIDEATRCGCETKTLYDLRDDLDAVERKEPL